MRSIANTVQVYQLSDHNAALVGLMFLFQGIAAIVVGFFGGTLADIVDRRFIIKFSVLGQILIAGVLALLTTTGHIQVWQIFALTFLGAAIGSVDGPTRSAMVSDLVPRRELMTAISLQSMVGTGAGLAGPALGGVVVGTLGATTAYVIDACLLIPAAVAIWMLRIPARAAARRAKMTFGAVFAGLQFTAKSPVLFGFLALDTVTMLAGYYPAMMVVMANDVLHVGSGGYGVLQSAPAFGALLGFLGLLIVGNVKRKGLLMIVVSIGHAIALFFFAVSPWFWLSLPLVATLGFMDSLSMSVRSTTFQLLAPELMRVRVMSMLFIAAVGANSLGGTVLGVQAKFFGPREALMVGAVIGGGFAVLVGLFWKKVRDYQS